MDRAFPEWVPFAILFFLSAKQESGKEQAMGARRIRREQRQVDMADSRYRNGLVKVKERARRDARMLETVKKGKLPYTPPVLSWLSNKLDKPGRLITQQDVQKLGAEQ
jgi:hypothetical protein